MVNTWLACVWSLNCCTTWILFWRSFPEYQLCFARGNYLNEWRNNDQIDVSLVIRVCQQLIWLSRVSASYASIQRYYNEGLRAFIGATHTQKTIALFRLNNCDLNIIPITNAVLGSMCNNRPFYQLNGPSDKKHEIKNCIVTFFI